MWQGEGEQDMAAEDLWHSPPCHSRSLSHERSQDHLKWDVFFSVQSYSTLSETDQTLDKWLSTIFLILRPFELVQTLFELVQLSLSWSNSQLVRFPRPTPRRWLLKSGGEPVYKWAGKAWLKMNKNALHDFHVNSGAVALSVPPEWVKQPDDGHQGAKGCLQQPVFPGGHPSKY